MEKLPELGKISPEFFNEVIYPRLGADNNSIIVKPQHGVDFGVIELGDKVVVTSTDPFFIAPALGWGKASWFAVHIIASDVAVSGIAPKYLAIDLNLPPEMSEDTLKTIWTTVDEECKKLGISVVTGHTARYAGCNYPMVGGATMFGIDLKEKLIIPKANIGDKIIITKGPAVETTGLMAMQFPEFLEKAYGKEFVKKAQEVFYQMSVVKDALITTSVGGVTAMHDATECGVFGGLYEIAQVSNVGMEIILKNIIIQDVIKKTCECFDINPYKAISEGTLIATVEPEKAEAVIKALKKENIPASIIGEVLPKDKGIVIIDGDKKYQLEHPRIDPFWIRFEEYLKKQSSENFKKENEAKTKKLNEIDLYFITDNKLTKKTVFDDVKSAIKAGVKIIQYREKEKSTRELIEEAAEIKELCKNKAIFLINDRIDVALAVKADGVHLGQDDIPYEIARSLLGEKIIGLTVHNVEEAIQAKKLGVDYISLSPIFETKTKLDAGPSLGIKLIKDIKKSVNIPVVAIGGINLENIDDVIKAGITSIAAISAIATKEDVEGECRKFINKLKNNLEKT